MPPFTPNFVSHKQVEAHPIAAAEFQADGSGKVALAGGSLVTVPPGFASRGAPAEGDMLVRYEPTVEEPDGYLSHSPRAVFEAGYRPLGARGPVLMSPGNPTGWKLEELLAALRGEVHAKCAKIAGDARPVARAVLRNNEQIMGLLRVAEALQRDSYDRLNAMAPDEGPLGVPRIGIGSPAPRSGRLTMAAASPIPALAARFAELRSDAFGLADALRDDETAAGRSLWASLNQFLRETADPNARLQTMAVATATARVVFPAPPASSPNP